MIGPLLIVASALLVVGYSMIYTGASLGTNWQTDFKTALLGGLVFVGSTSKPNPGTSGVAGASAGAVAPA